MNTSITKIRVRVKKNKEGKIIEDPKKVLEDKGLNYISKKDQIQFFKKTSNFEKSKIINEDSDKIETIDEKKQFDYVLNNFKNKKPVVELDSDILLESETEEDQIEINKIKFKPLSPIESLERFQKSKLTNNKTEKFKVNEFLNEIKSIKKKKPEIIIEELPKKIEPEILIINKKNEEIDPMIEKIDEDPIQIRKSIFADRFSNILNVNEYYTYDNE